jgi:hypothetical protein
MSFLVVLGNNSLDIILVSAPHSNIYSSHHIPSLVRVDIGKESHVKTNVNHRGGVSNNRCITK